MHLDLEMGWFVMGRLSFSCQQKKDTVGKLSVLSLAFPFFISLKQREEMVMGIQLVPTGKRKANGQHKYYSISLNQRRN